MNDDVLFDIDTGDGIQSASLADFAGIDMSQIDAVRGGGRAPEGVAEWRIVEAGLEVMQINDKDNPGQKRPCPVFEVKVESLGYRTVKDPAYAPEELVGVQHTERFFINKLREDMGRVRAFLEDIGLQNISGSLPELALAITGMEFVAPMKHRKDKNDPDRVFANLDTYHVEPMSGAAVPGAPSGNGAAAPAPQPAAPAQPAPQPAAGGGLRIGQR